MNFDRLLPEKRDFARGAAEYFSHLNYSIKSSKTMDYGGVVRTQSAFYWQISAWMETVLPRTSEEEWNKSVRSFYALQEGIESGGITISTSEDIAVLTRAIGVQIYCLPQVIEYYSYTGEFMDVMTLIQEIGSTPFVVDSLLKARRLYTEDILTVQRYLDAEEDPLPYMDLALEVRSGLSGASDRGVLGDPEEVLDNVIEPQDIIRRVTRYLSVSTEDPLA